MAKVELKPNFDSAKPLGSLGLTPREAEVLLWIAQGKSNADIGTIPCGTEWIPEKYELSIYEPLDKATNVWHPVKPPEVAHHHVEMSDRLQTVIVAHPQYLKVRVLGRSERYRYDWEALGPVHLGPEILQDLSALYGRV